MNIFIRKHIWFIIGLLIGALGGYIYWKFIGCTTGTCPITSSPLYCSIWGALIGALGLDLISSFFKNKKDEK